MYKKILICLKIIAGYRGLTIGIREGEESSYHMMIDNIKHEMTKIEEIKDI